MGIKDALAEKTGTKGEVRMEMEMSEQLHHPLCIIKYSGKQ